MSKNIRFKGLVSTLAQIAADKFAGRIAWASDLARLIYYYTDSNYAVLARKDVAETFAGILASNLTSNRIVTVGANGQLVDDAGLTRTQTNSVTRMVTIGDGLVAGSVNLRLNAPATQAVTTIYQIAGSDKWGTGSIANSANLRISNFVDGQLVDWPIVVVDGAGGEITFGGSAATKRDVNLTGNLKLAGIQRISSGGVAALTGMVNSATAGTGIRPKVALADGTDSAQDAATFRGTIGVAGAQRLDRTLNNAVGTSGYVLLAKLSVTAPGASSAILVDVMDAGLPGGDTSPNSYRITARLKQLNQMASPIDYAQVEVEQNGGGPAITFGHVVEQDNASEKRIAIYAVCGSWKAARYSVLGVYGSVAFYEAQSPITAPTGYVAATFASRKIGSLNVAGQAGTGSRMVQASADGTQSAVDAATARATIDAAQTSHTHTFASLTSKPTTLSGYGITNGSKIIAKSNATITVNNTTWTDVFSWTSTTYLLGPTTQGLMRSTADMSFSGSVSMQIIRDSTVLYSTTIGATTRFEFKYTDGNDGWMRCIGIMISNSTSSVFYPIAGGDDINQNAEHTWRIQCKGANGINVGGSYVTEAI